MAKTKSVIAEKKNSSNKDLSNELIGAINSQFKGSLAASAHYLADPEVLTDVKQWIPSGCTPLDFAISNRAGGGFPSGRICEIVGWEASGKSLLVAYALSNTQKAGGIAVYIDTESAVSSEYLTAIGVDIDSLIYIQQEALEDIFATIETIIEKVRLSDKKRLVTIVVDSIMGATTHKELEAEWGKDGYATDKALILSKAMRKITGMISKQNICLLFTNQLRQKLGVMFGDNFTTSGGKALAFHSSVRIKLESIGKITVKGKGGNDEIVGIKTRAKVIKNRLGPPLRSVEYNIFFQSLIDDYSSWFELLKNKNVITTSGPWNILKLEAPMQIVKEDSEVVTVSDLRFYTKDFQFLVSTNKELKNYLYSLLCKYMILEYKINEDFTSDDVTIDSNVEE